MKRSELIFTAILVPVDFLMLGLAGLAAYGLRTGTIIAQWRPVLFSLNLPFNRYFGLVLFVALIWLGVFALAGLYAMKREGRGLEEFFRIIIASSAGLMIVIVYIFIKREWFDSRFILLAAWIFAILFVCLGRFLVKKIQRFLVGRYKIGSHRVLIIGGDGVTENIKEEIKKRPHLGYEIIKHLSGIDMESIKASVSNPAVDDIILANPDFPREEVLDLINFCEDKHINFKFVPNLFQTLTINVEIDTLAAVPIIELKRTALDGWGKIIKRLIDVLGSLFGLILLSPLFLIVGFLIKLDSEGPVFVRLKRVSQGKGFYLYKFRSMIKNAETMKAQLLAFNERKDGPLFKMKNDPRVTKFGRLLRRYRIDEFPQFFNVLRGEMSIVGPRPHQPDEIEQYERHHKKLLAIKPGMTGPAQVSGSSDLRFEEEVKLDTYYIENWSLALDIKILIKTFFVIFIDRSAC